MPCINSPIQLIAVRVLFSIFMMHCNGVCFGGLYSRGVDAVASEYFNISKYWFW